MERAAQPWGKERLETRRSAGNHARNAAAVAEAGTPSPGRQRCPAPDYRSRRAAVRAVLSRAGRAVLPSFGTGAAEAAAGSGTGPGRAEPSRAEQSRAGPPRAAAPRGSAFPPPAAAG